MFGFHRFTMDAVRDERWDDAVDQLQFAYDGEPLELLKGHWPSWNALLTVVPVTEEDDRIHKYQKPFDDCLAHMEVQFRFQELSAKVEGVLGRTYQPDYVNPVKRGWRCQSLAVRTSAKLLPCSLHNAVNVCSLHLAQRHV
ncbi:hypothetical protein Taro_051419 [Colocasia esculenta]|uniref:Uncharacterized protein n=1 Tax=Colocasia esculenta TaxID=4460 RepID=A0A843XGI1_COLES|nr:hypothetical protein [Colocasia esculenta]